VKSRNHEISLFPLVELAGGQLQPDLDMDGRSLVPHLTGIDNKHDEVIGEYMAEGKVREIQKLSGIFFL
jgi:choline-sulfatase